MYTIWIGRCLVMIIHDLLVLCAMEEMSLEIIPMLYRFLSSSLPFPSLRPSNLSFLLPFLFLPFVAYSPRSSTGHLITAVFHSRTDLISEF